MAKSPDKSKPPKNPARTTRSKAGRPDVQPIGPALAELLNPAINRGDAGMGSGTGLQPPPDNSWDRRAGGEAAAHRARASTRGTGDDVAKRDSSATGAASRGLPPPNPPPQAGEGYKRQAPRPDGKDFRAEAQPSPPPACGEVGVGGAATAAPASSESTDRPGFGESPQSEFGPANYGTSAPIPTLDPELAKQLGFTTEEEDAAAMARPPRNKMEALGVAATADALESLIREGRPEFKGEDGQVKIWTPHRPPRPEKSEGGQPFVIKSEYEPKGDQPVAIRELVEGIKRNDRTQVLLGVTGSGKTYTMAKVIEATQRPAIILAPNKTLAAQLYGEFKSFFPDNAVEYFVSYYDYYQPEAYVPRTDTYIEKDLSINEQIDRMRHSATRSLLERDDVIIVASVSCIYGIGSVETYTAMTFALKKGERIDQRQLIADLVALQYKRTQADFTRGTFRVRGRRHRHLSGALLRRPAPGASNLFGDMFAVENIEEFLIRSPATSRTSSNSLPSRSTPIAGITSLCRGRPAGCRPSSRSDQSELKMAARPVEQPGPPAGSAAAGAAGNHLRSRNDGSHHHGSCATASKTIRATSPGLRRPGEPPPTLFEYGPRQCAGLRRRKITTLAVPQIGGMFKGDFRRKATLAEYGFAGLPFCATTVRCRYSREWDMMRPQSVAVSATPSGVGSFSDESGGVFVEQVIRPTGLIDPPGRHPPGPHPGRRSRRRKKSAPPRRPTALAAW